MKPLFKFSVLAIYCVAILAACSPRLYTDNPYEAGTLGAGTLDSIRSFLQTNSTVKLKDTIFIKYDFNNDDCWSDLNGQNPEFINNTRWAYQKGIQEKADKRPHVAIYQYREVGNNFSSVRSKGLEIETDPGILKQLLFKTKTRCGTSAIILPNGKFLLLKSDSHFAALLLDAKQIEQKLIENLVR